VPHFPEQLYALSARDRRGTTLDPFLRNVVLELADASSTASHQVPLGKSLLLKSVSTNVLVGAPASLVRTLIAVAPPNNAFLVILADRADGLPAGAVRSALQWSGDLLVPADWNVLAQQFSSAAAAGVHRLELSTAGILIPIGNVARV
jgi:hypothetical protein